MSTSLPCLSVFTFEGSLRGRRAQQRCCQQGTKAVAASAALRSPRAEGGPQLRNGVVAQDELVRAQLVRGGRNRPRGRLRRARKLASASWRGVRRTACSRQARLEVRGGRHARSRVAVGRLQHDGGLLRTTAQPEARTPRRGCRLARARTRLMRHVRPRLVDVVPLPLGVSRQRLPHGGALREAVVRVKVRDAVQHAAGVAHEEAAQRGGVGARCAQSRAAGLARAQQAPRRPTLGDARTLGSRG
jgi:hypothetical protein